MHSYIREHQKLRHKMIHYTMVASKLLVCCWGDSFWKSNRRLLLQVMSYYFSHALVPNHIACVIKLKSLFIVVQLILNCTVIIACSIATFSNCTLNWPIKMYGYESHLSATSYDISSKWNCTTLVLKECIVMDKYGNKMHLGWNKYNLEVFEAV